MNLRGTVGKVWKQDKLIKRKQWTYWANKTKDFVPLGANA